MSLLDKFDTISNSSSLMNSEEDDTNKNCHFVYIRYPLVKYIQKRSITTTTTTKWQYAYAMALIVTSGSIHGRVKINMNLESSIQ